MNLAGFSYHEYQAWLVARTWIGALCLRCFGVGMVVDRALSEGGVTVWVKCSQCGETQ